VFPRWIPGLRARREPTLAEANFTDREAEVLRLIA